MKPTRSASLNRSSCPRSSKEGSLHQSWHSGLAKAEFKCRSLADPTLHSVLSSSVVSPELCYSWHAGDVQAAVEVSELHCMQSVAGVLCRVLLWVDKGNNLPDSTLSSPLGSCLELLPRALCWPPAMVRAACRPEVRVMCMTLRHLPAHRTFCCLKILPVRSSHCRFHKQSSCFPWLRGHNDSNSNSDSNENPSNCNSLSSRDRNSDSNSKRKCELS